MNGYVFLAAIFATPSFGLLVDKVGRWALFMAGGEMGPDGHHLERPTPRSKFPGEEA